MEVCIFLESVSPFTRIPKKESKLLTCIGTLKKTVKLTAVIPMRKEVLRLCTAYRKSTFEAKASTFQWFESRKASLELEDDVKDAVADFTARRTFWMNIETDKCESWTTKNYIEKCSEVESEIECLRTVESTMIGARQAHATANRRLKLSAIHQVEGKKEQQNFNKICDASDFPRSLAGHCIESKVCDFEFRGPLAGYQATDQPSLSPSIETIDTSPVYWAPGSQGCADLTISHLCI